MRFLVPFLLLSAFVATVLAGNFRKTPGEVEYGAFGDYEVRGEGDTSSRARRV